MAGTPPLEGQDRRQQLGRSSVCCGSGARADVLVAAEFMVFRRPTIATSEYACSCRDAAEAIRSDHARPWAVAAGCFVTAAVLFAAALFINSAYGFTPWWVWARGRLMGLDLRLQPQG
ncbi:MAG: hypothetical protein IPJ41_10000 [Phycisphaerales bacterium]|nr:hypothetical protein [Phycisphaerales bacterium]